MKKYQISSIPFIFRFAGIAYKLFEVIIMMFHPVEHLKFQNICQSQFCTSSLSQTYICHPNWHDRVQEKPCLLTQEHFQILLWLLRVLL